MNYTDGSHMTCIAGGAIKVGHLVKFITTGSGDAAKAVTVCTTNDQMLGVVVSHGGTGTDAALGDPVTVKLHNSPGTFLVLATTTVVLANGGTALYMNTGGFVTPTEIATTVGPVFRALEAGIAGDLIEAIQHVGVAT